MARHLAKAEHASRVRTAIGGASTAAAAQVTIKNAAVSVSGFTVAHAIRRARHSRLLSGHDCSPA